MDEIPFPLESEVDPNQMDLLDLFDGLQLRPLCESCGQPLPDDKIPAGTTRHLDPAKVREAILTKLTSMRVLYHANALASEVLAAAKLEEVKVGRRLQAAVILAKLRWCVASQIVVIVRKAEPSVAESTVRARLTELREAGLARNPDTPLEDSVLRPGNRESVWAPTPLLLAALELPEFEEPTYDNRVL